MRLTKKQIKSGMDSKIRCLVRYDAENYTNGDLAKSMARVMSSKLYDLIYTKDTGIFLESIHYVYAAYEEELSGGEKGLMDFVYPRYD
jgi:hypothetical protein